MSDRDPYRSYDAVARKGPRGYDVVIRMRYDGPVETEFSSILALNWQDAKYLGESLIDAANRARNQNAIAKATAEIRAHTARIAAEAKAEGNY